MAEVDDQIIVPDKENINSNSKKPALPPKTPNYGKTPKYIEKYKEEAKAAADAKEELKAAKLRPPGTKVLPEDERVATLENLEKNKKEITKILMQMPISMRTESLRRQKVELEQKLIEIDRAIEMFSRKIVYVKQNE